jgi:hypothetical protein
MKDNVGSCDDLQGRTLSGRKEVTTVWRVTPRAGTLLREP